jgi:hypothetical protein
MIFDKYDELKARGKPPLKVTPIAIGGQKVKGKRQKVKEITSPSVFWLAKPRLRLTGRAGPVQTSSSGPPGSVKLISGVPAWLEPPPAPPKEGSKERGKDWPWLSRGTPLVPITIGSMNDKNFVMLCEFFVNSVLYPTTGGEHEEDTENHRELHLNKGRPLALHGKTNAAGGKSNVEEASPLPLQGSGERKKFGLSVFEYVNEKKKCRNCKRILCGKSPFRDGVKKECRNAIMPARMNSFRLA